MVFHTWSDKLWATSLSYFIGLLSTIGFENVFVFKSWCHSICIYDNFVHLSGLPNFISMHLFYMYWHTYAFYQVPCVIYYRVYYYYFDCTVYGISQQSSILHISFTCHPKILVLKIGWSLINCKDFTCVEKALGLTVYRLQISLWSNNLTNVIYFIISYILNETVLISGPFCVIFKTFCNRLFYSHGINFGCGFVINPILPVKNSCTHLQADNRVLVMPRGPLDMLKKVLGMHAHVVTKPYLVTSGQLTIVVTFTL